MRVFVVVAIVLIVLIASVSLVTKVVEAAAIISQPTSTSNQ